MDSKKVSMLSFAGAGIALVCFFLPWISISFFGMSFSFTGAAIASGGGSAAEIMEGSFAGNSLLYLFPALAVLTAAVAYFGEAKLGAKNASLSQLVLGFVALGLWAYLVFSWNSEFSKSMAEAAEYGFSMSFWSVMGIGFWGTAVGFLAVVVAGFLSMKNSGNVASSSQPQEPQV